MPRVGRRKAGADAPPDEAMLVARLRDGEEAAFTELLNRYGSTMLRVAQMYVKDRASAEEVVQETWLAVLNGIDRFEGRSSLKTWLFRILTNRAKTRGERDGRTLPFSALAGSEAESGEPAVPGPHHRAPGRRTGRSLARPSA
jgi:RNA polymerase sigma-70 factor (ECF subfamily)